MGDNTIRKVDKGAEKLANKAKKAKTTGFASKSEYLGKLELQIAYSRDSLSVYLGQAKGLPSKDVIGTSDPYARVYLLHANPAALFVKGHEQTKSFNNNLTPFFNDTFTFNGISKESLLAYKLVIAIWDKDIMSDEYMCGLRVCMSHFAFDDKGHLNLKFWANLQTSYLDGHPLEVSQAVLTQYIRETITEKSVTSTSSSSASSTPSIKKKQSTVMERLAATVTFTVSYDPRGFLKIFLIRAQGLPDKDLIGKSDPYAKIYLLGENNTKFLDHNKKLKTKTKKNTQSPDFHEGFEFQMNLQLIRNLKTVIEIWDDDFGKDDFLSGVLFNMSSFNLAAEVELTVSLYSGRTNNLPFEVDDVMRFSTKKTSSVVPLVTTRVSTTHLTKPRSRSSSSSSSSSSDDDTDARYSLRQSNNKLISYIEKARIMAQAYGIGQSIPDAIHVEENVRSMQSQDVELNTQFHDYLKPAIAQAQDKVRNARDELERLRDRNRKLNIQYEERARVLTEKERVIWNLENDLMTLQGKCTMIQHEFIRIKEWEESLDREHEYYVEQMAEARRVMGSIDVDLFKREIEMKETSMAANFQMETEQEIEKRVSEVQIPISVYTQFKERMEKELREKRKVYLKSVGKIQMESKQILAMYDNIVMAKERGSLDSHRKASMMEKIGFYRGDVANIESDVAKLRMELQRLQSEHERKKDEYDLKLRLKQEEFELFRRQFETDLEAWFARYGAEFNAWCREQLELAIYSKLLEFEEQRLSTTVYHPRDMAKVSTTKRRSNYNSGPRTHHEERFSIAHGDSSMRNSVSSRSSSTIGYSTTGASAMTSSVKYSTQSKARKESGYHSPGTKTPGNKTPEGTLDRSSQYSDVFSNIRSDVEMDEFHI